VNDEKSTGVGDVDDHPKIAQKAPAARVVKAFDTTFAGTLVAGAVPPDSWSGLPRI
jgi:predicted dinucleotide-binding enzyme